MAAEMPEHLTQEQQAVEAQIREAFKGVSRAGGRSWSEAEVIDDYGSKEEMAAARDRDRETSWEDLVDDPNWEEEPGTAGFNFLDAVGYRYYIAPAMIRCTRRGDGEFVGYALTIDGDYRRKQVSRISPEQARAIARFVRFMITAHDARQDEIYDKSWRHAYEIYWKQWDAATL